MKKTRILIGIVVLVALGYLAWIALERKETKSTLDPRETEFAVKDTAKITRIFISEKNGNTNVFERKPNQPWLLNGQYQVDIGRMNVLMETIYGIEVRRNVTKNEFNTVIKDLATESIKVEVYLDDRLAKVYYIGNEDNTTSGSYGILDRAENPYLLHLPGLQGIITTRFYVNVNDWRSKKLFGSNPESIKSIQVSYTNSPKDGFTVEQTSAGFKVKELTAIDTLKLSTYVNYFRKVYGESLLYYYEQDYKDSIYGTEPSGFVQLVDDDSNKSNTIKFWIIDDPGAMYGLDDHINDLLRIQIPIMEPILVRRSHFIPVRKEE